ncbi:hypothetical protein ANO11243_011150 [Dothideomycetidae sp. 11243]|nr:hypothetical protein ANO11243_011150 [fungal sp. No.11243]
MIPSDQDDELLAYRLLEEELKEFEDQQRGKYGHESTTDLEALLAFHRHELVQARTCRRDQILATNTNVAITIHHKLLIQIANEETLAERDHLLAIALNAEQAAEVNNQESDGDDTVSNSSGEPMEGIIRTHKPNNKPLVRKIACVSCSEHHDPESSFHLSCGHHFCRECTRQMFLTATKDEELYPPRCCGQTIAPDVPAMILDDAELQNFAEKAIEYETADRLYCAEPACSKFIPPSALASDVGTCSACGRQTHLPCRSLAHPGIDCPLDVGLQEALATAAAQNWKRCSQCRTMVELELGCNHITCRCGHDFCYVCGANWKTCTCPIWQEDRILEVANQQVNEEVAPNADPVVRERAVAQAVQVLRQHEDVACEHHRARQWAWKDRGSLRCELCLWYMPYYIFMCRLCRMRACWACRRHRLR